MRFVLAIFLALVCSCAHADTSIPDLLRLPDRKDSGPRVAELPFLTLDDIELGSGLLFIKDLQRIVSKPGIKTIVVLVDSHGGFTDTEASMVRAMKATGLHTVCIVDRRAASAAFDFLQWCDERVVKRNSILMAHQVKMFFFNPNMPWSEKDLRDGADELKEATIKYARHCSSRSKMSFVEFMDAIDGKDFYMSGSRAVELGFADRVVDDIPSELARFL